MCSKHTLFRTNALLGTNQTSFTLVENYGWHNNQVAISFNSIDTDFNLLAINLIMVVMVIKDDCEKDGTYFMLSLLNIG